MHYLYHIFLLLLKDLFLSLLNYIHHLVFYILLFALCHFLLWIKRHFLLLQSDDNFRRVKYDFSLLYMLGLIYYIRVSLYRIEEDYFLKILGVRLLHHRHLLVHQILRNYLRLILNCSFLV